MLIKFLGIFFNEEPIGRFVEYDFGLDPSQQESTEIGLKIRLFEVPDYGLELPERVSHNWKTLNFPVI